MVRGGSPSGSLNKRTLRGSLRLPSQETVQVCHVQQQGPQFFHFLLRLDEELAPGLEVESLPLESYVRPAVLELLRALGGIPALDGAGGDAAVTLPWGGETIGRGPVRLSMGAAGGRVEEIDALEAGGPGRRA